MKWNPSPPTEPGTYWALNVGLNQVCAVTVVKYGEGAPTLAWVPHMYEPEMIDCMDGWMWWPEKLEGPCPPRRTRNDR